MIDSQTVTVEDRLAADSSCVSAPLSDDTVWTQFGTFKIMWGPPPAPNTGGNGLWPSGDGGATVSVEVKWDGTYQWLRLRDDVYGGGSGFEAVFRKVVASATTGSNVTGKATFTASEIYSLEYDGISSSDYSGIGDTVYLATATAATDFTDAHFAVAFTSGEPPTQWRQIGTRYHSIESLSGQTIEVDLTNTIPMHVPASSFGLDQAGCYEDSRTAGSYGVGCSMTVAYGDTPAYGKTIQVLASGSVKVGGSNTLYGCADSGTTLARDFRRTYYALILSFHADWFDAFAVSGSVTTGGLPPFGTFAGPGLVGTGNNYGTGWDTWWGGVGSLTIAVS
jgi:hypothetical protein